MEAKAGTRTGQNDGSKSSSCRMTGKNRSRSFFGAFARAPGGLIVRSSPKWIVLYFSSANANVGEAAEGEKAEAEEDESCADGPSEMDSVKSVNARSVHRRSPFCDFGTI